MVWNMNLFIYMYSKCRFLCVFCRRIVKARKVDRVLHNVLCIVTLSIVIYVDNKGGSREGAHPARAPLNFFGVKSWFFTRNTPKSFAPPSARRNLFKCHPPPLAWNPGSASGQYMYSLRNRPEMLTKDSHR